MFSIDDAESLETNKFMYMNLYNCFFNSAVYEKKLGAYRLFNIKSMRTWRLFNPIIKPELP